MNKPKLLESSWRSVWLNQRYKLAAILVLLNSGLIFKTVYGMSDDILHVLYISNFSNIDFVALTNAPWFMLGFFLLINSIGLFFRARIAWIMSLVLLLTTLLFTVHYYSEQYLNMLVPIITVGVLLLFSKDFYRSSATAGGIVAIISFTILIVYSTYGSLYFGEGFSPKIDNLSKAFYFSMFIIAMVGYGDILPVSEAARLFTISMIIAGIAVFATSISSIFGPLISKGFNKLVRGRKDKMNRTEHFIICGTSTMAMNTVMKLRQRGLPVTIVTVRPAEEFGQIEQRLEGEFDIISGDSCDSSVLKTAGVEECRAILALTENDADNAFIVLSAKEISSKAKTVVIVNDSKNLNKIKMVQPDMLLSPQLFGSELLARMLNGEEVGNTDLVSMLFSSAGKETTQPNASTVKKDSQSEQESETSASAPRVDDTDLTSMLINNLVEDDENKQNPTVASAAETAEDSESQQSDKKKQ